MDMETFEKARRYGRDKTRYALSKCLFDQVLSWFLIRMEVYSSMWDFAGKAMNSLGLSQDRTVSVHHPFLPRKSRHLLYLASDTTDHAQLDLDHRSRPMLHPPLPPLELLLHFHLGRTTRFQQVHQEAVDRRPDQNHRFDGGVRASDLGWVLESH